MRLFPQTYTADPLLEWVDVKEWVVENYPWSSSMNVGKLRTLNPDDVGWNHGMFLIVCDYDYPLPNADCSLCSCSASPESLLHVQR